MGRHVVANALRGAGFAVEVHADHFAPGTADVDWLREIGARGWIVIGKDEAIRRNKHERATLLANGVRAFFLTRQNLTGEEAASLLLQCMPAIARRVSRSRGPFICSISRSARVVLVDDGN